jgi:hypothetical protein
MKPVTFMKEPDMRLAILTIALFCNALAAAAQDVLSSVAGNFGGPEQDGPYFEAEVYQSAEFLGLRIWEGASPEAKAKSLTLENNRFALTPIGGRSRLETLSEGPLIF